MYSDNNVFYLGWQVEVSRRMDGRRIPDDLVEPVREPDSHDETWRINGVAPVRETQAVLRR